MSPLYFLVPLFVKFCSVLNDTPRYVHYTHAHTDETATSRTNVLAPLSSSTIIVCPFFFLSSSVPLASPLISLLLSCRSVSVWPLFFVWRVGWGKRRKRKVKCIRQNERFFTPSARELQASLAVPLSLNSILIAERWMRLRNSTNREKPLFTGKARRYTLWCCLFVNFCLLFFFVERGNGGKFYWGHDLLCYWKTAVMEQLS